MPKGIYVRKPRGPCDPETKARIAASLKGNENLKAAMRKVHAERIASGEDGKIRQKIRATRIANGDWLDRPKTEFDAYKAKVRNLTEEQPVHTLENSHLRGQGAYHLDHVVSKKTGFELGFPPEFIADMSNLRFITEHENCSKQGYNKMDDITSLWFHLSETLEFE